MWRKFGVIGTKKTAFGTQTKIGGQNKDAQNKIDWNTEREGREIIEASEKEVLLLKVNIEKWLKVFINKTFAG
jgi:hypothetical protein